MLLAPFPNQQNVAFCIHFFFPTLLPWPLTHLHWCAIYTF